MLPTAFDRWLHETFAREGGFTLFVILFEDAPGTIVPIASSYLHVVGTQIRWDDLVALLDQSGMVWQKVAVFGARDPSGGPLADTEARHRLPTLQQSVLRDRLTVRQGELFDRQGRRLNLEPLNVASAPG